MNYFLQKYLMFSAGGILAYNYITLSFADTFHDGY